MIQAMFQSVFSLHYGTRTRNLFIVPISLILLFGLVLGLLCLAKTDKVVLLDGRIMPQKTHALNAGQSGIVQQSVSLLGRSVRRGEVLLHLTLADGSVAAMAAPHDGVIVDSAIDPTAGMRIAQGALLASIIDPTELAVIIDLPEKLRGVVNPGASVSYRINNADQPTKALLRQGAVRLDGAHRVSYQMLSSPDLAHQKMAYLGRKFPVRILIENVSLLDYFLND